MKNGEIRFTRIGTEPDPAQFWMGAPGGPRPVTLRCDNAGNVCVEEVTGGGFNLNSMPITRVSAEEFADSTVTKAYVDGAAQPADYKEETDAEQLARLDVDAQNWAREFYATFCTGSPVRVDIDALRVWFANAIEAGRTAGFQAAWDECSDMYEREAAACVVIDNVPSVEPSQVSQSIARSLNALGRHHA